MDTRNLVRCYQAAIAPSCAVLARRSRLAPNQRRSVDGTEGIHVPGRPFLKPVFDKHRQPDDVSRRFLARLLGGSFGTP